MIGRGGGQGFAKGEIGVEVAIKAKEREREEWRNFFW
jgi:hypothetical protein